MRNSNVGGMSYKAPPSGLPQGRGSLRASREHAWWLTGSQGAVSRVRPGLLGPLTSVGMPLPPPTPLGLSFPPPVFLPPFLLFHPEDGPLTWVTPSSSRPRAPTPPQHDPCPTCPSLWLRLTLPTPLPSSQALCAAVTTSDLAETQALLGCGAGVNCFSGDPEVPTPLALAEQAGQTLQMEFLRNNRTTGEWLVGPSSSRDGASLLPGSGPLEGMPVIGC